MQRVVDRHWQTARRAGTRRISDQRKTRFEFRDFLELSAEYDRRMIEISRLMHKAGSNKADFRHRMEGLVKQQLECSNRIREVIRCIMGWCY